MNTPNTNTPQPARKTLTLRSNPRSAGTNFYFVWAPTRRRPRQRHQTRDAAIAEADRIAQLNPGVEFVVYEARAIARRGTPL
jgi:hypothetical protein